MRKIAFDLETSDFHENGGKPVEIGAVLLGTDKQEISAFHSYMKLSPGEKMDDDAFDCHGIHPLWLEENAPSRAEARHKFKEWLRENDIDLDGRWQIQFIGQNISFDLKFFWEWWGEEQKSWVYYCPIDTMLLADTMNSIIQDVDGYGTEPFIKTNTNGRVVPSASLEAQANFFGFDYTGAHSALFDARLTANCWREHIKCMGADIRAARSAKPSTSEVTP